MSATIDAANAELVPLIKELLKRHAATTLSACLMNQALQMTVLALGGKVPVAHALVKQSVRDWFRDCAPFVAVALAESTDPKPKKDVH